MQGYLTLGTGSRFYLEQAVNLSLSLKLNDPTRPVCLLTDDRNNIPRGYGGVWDDVVTIEPEPGFFGCLNKLRIQPYSPYDETMFIDADCILVKSDMDRHWSRFHGDRFAIAADKVTSGSWYGFDIATVIHELGIDYIAKMNSGLFYFTSGSASQQFFGTALDLVKTHKSLLGVVHRKKVQLADEPFIGAAVGKLHIEPIRYAAAEGSVMITTVHASGCDFDPFTQRSAVTKHGNYAILGRFWPRSKTAHSPSVAHFVKLRPAAVYQRISDSLRQHFSLPAYQFS